MNNLQRLYNLLQDLLERYEDVGDNEMINEIITCMSIVENLEDEQNRAKSDRACT